MCHNLAFPGRVLMPNGVTIWVLALIVTKTKGITRAMHRIFLACLVGSLSLISTGCLLSGNYHSAKPIGKGESAFGMNFSATSYEVDDSRIAVPNLIPELTYHIGMSDDLEVGGRVAIGALAIEGDAKFRFYKSDNLHLAIAPALAYQSLLVIEGLTLRMPVIATVDVAPNFGFTVAGFGSTTRYSEVNADDSDSDFGPFSGSWVSTGVALGVELRGETFEIRPSLEFTRFAYRYDDSNSDVDGFNTVNLLVHIAFIGGREKKQLNRIEQKLDGMAPQPQY